jgi:hypothetical protein
MSVDGKWQLVVDSPMGKQNVVGWIWPTRTSGWSAR